MLRAFWTRWRVDTRGATAIEYALICSIIAGGMIAVLPSFKISIASKFSLIGTSLGNAASAAANRGRTNGDEEGDD